MATLAYLNGRFILDGELRLSYADAGFVYGATVTDFCRTYQHKLFRWADHLARLRRDAATCHIPILQTDAELTKAAEHLVATHAKGLKESDDLAVITFATPGPLGYLLGSTMDGVPTLGMHCFPLPKERYRRFFTDGVELQSAGTIGAGIVPLNVKHRSRLAWWMAGKTVEAGRVPVLFDQSGSPDTAIGAVLTVIGDTVYRAEAGTVLESVSLKVVEELCGEVGLQFAQVSGKALHQEMDASEMMLAGSAFGVAGIKRFDSREFAWPGPVTQKLQAAWSRLVGMDTAGQMLQ
jgi:branched-subunit amino acid aminotransferase/4-amino-4-deoxychorismate lyase